MGESKRDLQHFSDDQVAQLEQKVASDPAEYKYLVELAGTYVDRGQWLKAIDAYQGAIALEPDKDYLYNNLAIVYEEAGEPENAEKNYLKALSIKPDDATTQLNLGLLYKQQGRTNEAIRYLNRCLNNSGDPDEVSDAREELSSLLRVDDDRQWVQVAETIGFSQTEMIIDYLRDQGIRAIAFGSSALGLITGANAPARVMVPEEEAGVALSLLEPDDIEEDEIEEDEIEEDNIEEDNIEEDNIDDLEGDHDDEAYPASDFSGIDKAVLGATAVSLNPLGAVIGYTLSKIIGAEKDDEDLHFDIDLDIDARLIDCPNCGFNLELSDDEILDGRFTCPVCDQVSQFDDLVICPKCQTLLELEADEFARGWYICPECRWALHTKQL